MLVLVVRDLNVRTNVAAVERLAKRETPGYFFIFWSMKNGIAVPGASTVYTL
jgi:hypothetical protein